LGEYTTKEKDVQKGISRIPLELARIQEEDLVNIEIVSEEEKVARPSMTGVPNVEIMNEIESNINHRGNAYLASRISGSIEDYD
jgi:hypothetical protein